MLTRGKSEILKLLRVPRGSVRGKCGWRNGVDGAPPSKMALRTLAHWRHGRVGKIMDGKIIFWRACSGILKKFRGWWEGWHPLSSKAVPASATGQRALGEANATDDTAVVPPGGTCSVRSVDIARSSRWPKARSLAQTSLSLLPILARPRGARHGRAGGRSPVFSARGRRRGFRARRGGPRS